MKVEELEREIMALTVSERGELLKRLEARAAHEHKAAGPYPVGHKAFIEGVLEDLGSVGKKRPTFYRYPERDPNRPPGVYLIWSKESPGIGVDIFARIREDASNVADSVVLACIKRWEKIVQCKHVVPQDVYAVAKAHLVRVGAELVAGAENRQLPREVVEIAQIRQWELTYLRHAFTLLSDPSVKQQNEVAQRRLVKADLDKKFDNKQDGIETIEYYHRRLVNQVVSFLKSAVPRRHQWETWQNAYIKWRKGWQSTDTAKKTATQARKALRQAEKSDLLVSLRPTDPEGFNGLGGLSLYTPRLRIKKSWVEI
ncbi:MAG: hypothetical protein WKF84_28775 [Pyrinomonadaceae bacterium]